MSYRKFSNKVTIAHGQYSSLKAQCTTGNNILALRCKTEDLTRMKGSLSLWLPRFLPTLLESFDGNSPIDWRLKIKFVDKFELVTIL